MNDPSDYTITVRRFFEDDSHIFKATVKELPHVQGVGDTYSEAYEMVLEAIGGLQAMALEDGAPFPVPAQVDLAEWSGRVTLRLPKSLHRSATQVAEDEDVSFNQFLVTVIADAVARKSAVPLEPKPVLRGSIGETYRVLDFATQAIQKRIIVEHPRQATSMVTSLENVRQTSFQTSQRSDCFFVSGLMGNG